MTPEEFRAFLIAEVERLNTPNSELKLQLIDAAMSLVKTDEDVTHCMSGYIDGILEAQEGK